MALQKKYYVPGNSNQAHCNISTFHTSNYELKISITLHKKNIFPLLQN